MTSKIYTHHTHKRAAEFRARQSNNNRYHNFAGKPNAEAVERNHATEQEVAKLGEKTAETAHNIL